MPRIAIERRGLLLDREQPSSSKAIEKFVNQIPLVNSSEVLSSINNLINQVRSVDKILLRYTGYQDGSFAVSTT